jgi:hypothetical protein
MHKYEHKHMHKHKHKTKHKHKQKYKHKYTAVLWSPYAWVAIRVLLVCVSFARLLR